MSFYLMLTIFTILVWLLDAIVKILVSVIILNHFIIMERSNELFHIFPAFEDIHPMRGWGSQPPAIHIVDIFVFRLHSVYFYYI